MSRPSWWPVTARKPTAVVSRQWRSRGAVRRRTGDPRRWLDRAGVALPRVRALARPRACSRPRWNRLRARELPAARLVGLGNSGEPVERHIAADPRLDGGRPLAGSVRTGAWAASPPWGARWSCHRRRLLRGGGIRVIRRIRAGPAARLVASINKRGL